MGIRMHFYGISLIQILLWVLLISFSHSLRMNCRQVQRELNSWLPLENSLHSIPPRRSFNDKGMRICYDGSQNKRKSCCSHLTEQKYITDGNKQIRKLISMRNFDKILRSKQAALKKDERQFRQGVTNYIIHTIAARFGISTSSLRSIVDTFLTQLLFDSAIFNETVVVENFIIDLSPLIYYYNLKRGAKQSLEKRQQECVADSYKKHRRITYKTKGDSQSIIALKKTKTLNQRLKQSIDLLLYVLKKLEDVRYPEECLEAMARNHLCPICFGTANSSSVCSKTCLNVFQGCHIHWADLNASWNRYKDAIQSLIMQMKNKWNLTTTLHKIIDSVLKLLTENIKTELKSFDINFIAKCFVAGKQIESVEARPVTPNQTPKFPTFIGKSLQAFDDVMKTKTNFLKKLVQKPCQDLPNVNCWNGTHLSPTGYSKPVPEFHIMSQRTNPEVSRQSEEQENVIVELKRRLDGHRSQIITDLREKQSYQVRKRRRKNKIYDEYEGSGFKPEGSGDLPTRGSPPDEEEEDLDSGSGTQLETLHLGPMEKVTFYAKTPSNPPKNRVNPQQTTSVTMIRYKEQPKENRRVSSSKSVTTAANAACIRSPSSVWLSTMLSLLAAAWCCKVSFH